LIGRFSELIESLEGLAGDDITNASSEIIETINRTSSALDKLRASEGPPAVTLAINVLFSKASSIKEASSVYPIDYFALCIENVNELVSDVTGLTNIKFFSDDDLFDDVQFFSEFVKQRFETIIEELTEKLTYYLGALATIVTISITNKKIEISPIDKKSDFLTNIPIDSIGSA